MPSSSYCEISLKTPKVTLMVGLKKRSEVRVFILWEQWMCQPNFTAIRWVVVEMFQSGVDMNQHSVGTHIQRNMLGGLLPNWPSLTTSFPPQEPSLGLPLLLLLLLPLGPPRCPGRTMVQTSVRGTSTPSLSSEGKSLYLRYQKTLFLKRSLAHVDLS